MLRARNAAGVAFVGAAVAVGCGSSGTKDEPTPSGATGATARTAGAAVGPGTVQVRMRGGRFVPARVRARVGQVVTWVNEDARSHTVTDRATARFASRRLRPMGTFTYRVSVPGTITYTSRGEAEMRGTIVVAR